MLQIVLTLLVGILFQICMTKQNIVHIAPNNADEVHQLNEHSQFQLNTIKRHGWLIEANSKTKFNVYLKLKTIDHNRMLYMYFTANELNCSDYELYNHIPIIVQNQSAKNNLYKCVIEVSLVHMADSVYYICLQNGETFEHQGRTDWLTVITYEVHIPLLLKILIYIMAVAFAAIFNGLNLGLMSLNINELRLLMKTSDSLDERKYAENILPLRKNGNFLLCSILLTLTLSSSVSTLLLDDMTDGLLAGIISTIVLCIFSEILPQAICSKFALPIGSYTRKFTYFFLILMSPVAYPFSRLVDCILGKEVPAEYNRDKIKELIKNSKELMNDELQIISGALDFRNKTVSDIMIRLDDVFMLNENTVLDFNTMLFIYNSGYSRIPIYHESKTNITGWLHIKDLCLIDPQDKMPLYRLLHLFKHKVNYFHCDCKLDTIFETFRKGETHLAFVFEQQQQQLNCEPSNTIQYSSSSGTTGSTSGSGGDGESCRKCIGIVTLHDVIEALVQFEINDEYDHQHEKSKYSALFLKQIVSKYTTEYGGDLTANKTKTIDLGLNKYRLDPQTRLVIIQRLCSLLPFKEDFITKNILEQLIIKEEHLVEIRIPSQQIDCQINDEHHYIYKYGKASNSFIMLLKGKLTLEIGNDKIEYTAKPFEHFGIKSLIGDCVNYKQVLNNDPTYKSYVPEYSLKVDYGSYWKSESVENDFCFSLVYLKIDRMAWLNAVKATQLKKSTLLNSSSVEINLDGHLNSHVLNIQP